MAARTTTRRTVTTTDDGPSQRDVMNAATAATAAATAASVAATGASTAAIAASAAAADFGKQFQTISDRLLRVEEHRITIDDTTTSLNARMGKIETSVDALDTKLDEILVNQSVSRRGIQVIEWMIGIFSALAIGFAGIRELFH